MAFPLSPGKDRLAVGLAFAALLLLFVFFVALQRNLDGLSQEIGELRELNSAVLSLEARRVGLDGRVTELNALPRKTTDMALENQLKGMAHATQDLERQLDGKHRDKLEVIRALLQEIGDDVGSSR